MRARVLVTTVSVETIETTMPGGEYEAVPGAWDASGIVVGSGQFVTWSKNFSGRDVMPMPGSYVEVELEPDTWRAVQ